jgi:protein associated with RNAse G/E
VGSVRFRPGQLIVRRHFQHDLLSRVWLGQVVADDDSGTWMWVASGSAYRDLGSADGRHLRALNFADWPTTEKKFDETPWRGQALMLHPREGDYSCWLFFDSDGAFARYYVNLELPAVRWFDHGTGLAGLDTVDYDLDVIVEPDLAWHWKDEDEFAERLRRPDIYWVDDEATVRAEGERLIKLAQAGQFPFDGAMTDYRPDPTWPVPTEMPTGWDRPRAF